MRIHLPDGKPEGLQHLTVSNWDLDGHVCSRNRYPVAKADGVFQRSGIYILEGETNPPSALPKLYVGKATSLVNRVSYWYAKLDFWQRVITFSTLGDPPTETRNSFLEHSLIKRGKELRRAEFVNDKTPRLPPISMADFEDSEVFLEHVLTILPVVGIKAFESPGLGIPGQVFEETHRQLYYNERDSHGEGYATDGGFLLQKGSTGRAENLPAAPPWLRNLRNSLIDAGVLREDGSRVEVVQDYEFGSSSTAAAILVGGTVPGPIRWKTRDGKTLKQLEAEAMKSRA